MPRSPKTSRFWGEWKPMFLVLNLLWACEKMISRRVLSLFLFSIKVIWEKDLAVDSPLPWYMPLDKRHFSLSGFRTTGVGRFISRNMVRFSYAASCSCYVFFNCSKMTKLSPWELLFMLWNSGISWVFFLFSIYWKQLISAWFSSTILGQGPRICGTCSKGKSKSSSFSRESCRRAIWRWKVWVLFPKQNYLSCHSSHPM